MSRSAISFAALGAGASARVIVPALVAGVAVIWIGNLFGLWWMAMLAGFAVGLLPWSRRLVYGVAGLVAVLGWGLALAWQATQQDIGGAAAVVAGIMGFGAANGYITIVVALLLALLLGAAGAWVGVALRELLAPWREPAAPKAPVAAPAPATPPLAAPSRPQPQRQRAARHGKARKRRR